MKAIKKVLKRLKNKKVLLATVSGVLMILVNTGVITEDISSNYLNTFNIVLSILVGLGIVSDPRTNEEKEEQ